MERENTFVCTFLSEACFNFVLFRIFDKKYLFFLQLMSKNIPASDRVLRSHTRAQKEKKISNDAEKIVNDLKKSIKGDRNSSADLANKINEFGHYIEKEIEKTAEIERLLNLPIKHAPLKDSPMSDELINKIKIEHKKMSEEVEKEIEFVLNLCRDMKIDLE